MGSVKDPIIQIKPTENQLGTGHFVFSDRYSVFDWGEMPDQIPDKGKAICIATSYFFEKLEESGISSHYLGVVEDGEAKKLSQLNNASDTLKVKFLRVIEPQLNGDIYDYSVFKELKGNYLIPLEVIFRNSLPEGSSVFRRLKAGSLKLEDIGLTEMPEPGTIFDQPLLDVSTKLETKDRYINWEEAKTIANLTDDELGEIRRITLQVNDLITKEAAKLGLFHEDGKIEFGFDENRQLVIVDALGTLDEGRFTFQGLPISKELARINYRGTDWHKDVSNAQKQGVSQWRDLVTPEPAPLPPKFLNSIAAIYCNYANDLTGKQWFDVPPTADVLADIKSLVE